MLSRRNPLLATSAAAMAELGAMVARTQQAKRDKKRAAKQPKAARSGKINPAARRGESTGYLAANPSMRLIDAPSHVGVVSTSRARHTPFRVSGRAFGFSLTTAALAVPTLLTNAGVTFVNNNFDVDVLGANNTLSNFNSFPQLIYNIGVNFTRYRFRKLIMSYVPVQPTSNAGIVTYAVSPEVNTGNLAPVPYGNVSSTEVNVSGPVWSPLKLDALASGGLRTEWLYCDSTNSTAQSAIRQESAGNFRFHCAGTLASTLLGQIWYEYEIEFDGIANEADMQSRMARVQPTPMADAHEEKEVPLPPTPAGYVLVRSEEKLDLSSLRKAGPFT